MKVSGGSIRLQIHNYSTLNSNKYDRRTLNSFDHKLALPFESSAFGHMFRQHSARKLDELHVH